MMESAQGEGTPSSMEDGDSNGGAELQGANSATGGGGDWRAQFPPVTRNYAVTQRGYMQTVIGKKLSMEDQKEIRQTPVNAEAIPEQNPVDTDMPLGFLPQYPMRAASLPMLGQSMLDFSQTPSTRQDMSGVQRNTVNQGFTEGNPQDIYAAQMRRLMFLQKEQQRQFMLMQQHTQKQQKPPMQQHIQQQSLLQHPTFALATQQPTILQKFSGLQPGQSTVPYFPTKQPILVSRQQQQQSTGQLSILQNGSVSGALQQESTLPMKLQSYPRWTSTMQPNNRTCSLEPLPRLKQEELIRMNESMQQRQRILRETQLQLEVKLQSQKVQQAPMPVTHHHSENDVNELKDMYLVVNLLLSLGVLVAILFMVYNHWLDLWWV